MTTGTDIRNLLRQFTGKGNIIAVPRVFIAFTGSADAALLLNQILYWSERTDDPDGWFWHTGADWEAEVGLTYFKVTRIAKHLGSYLERKIKRVSGRPVTHYRINFETFSDAFFKFLENQDTRKSDFEVSSISEIEVSSKTYNKESETTTKTINTGDVFTDVHTSLAQPPNGSSDVPVEQLPNLVGLPLLRETSLPTSQEGLVAEKEPDQTPITPSSAPPPLSPATSLPDGQHVAPTGWRWIYPLDGDTAHLVRDANQPTVTRCGLTPLPSYGNGGPHKPCPECLTAGQKTGGAAWKVGDRCYYDAGRGKAFTTALLLKVNQRGAVLALIDGDQVVEKSVSYGKLKRRQTTSAHDASLEEYAAAKARAGSIVQVLNDAIARHIQRIDPKLASNRTGILAQKAAGVWRKKLDREKLTVEDYAVVARSIEPFVSWYRRECDGCSLPTGLDTFEDWYTRFVSATGGKAQQSDDGYVEDPDMPGVKIPAAQLELRRKRRQLEEMSLER